jgi:hypothetical protein
MALGCCVPHCCSAHACLLLVVQGPALPNSMSDIFFVAAMYFFLRQNEAVNTDVRRSLMARAHASHVHVPLLLLSLRFEAFDSLKCSARRSSSNAGLLSFCCCYVQSKRGASLPSQPCPLRVTLLAVIWQPSAMMASPMRASSASATFDGQYVQPTREGLTALSITLTYLFNSQGSNGVSCLQGSWTRLAVLFGPHNSRLLVYCIRWTFSALSKCHHNHNVRWDCLQRASLTPSSLVRLLQCWTHQCLHLSPWPCAYLTPTDCSSECIYKPSVSSTTLHWAWMFFYPAPLSLTLTHPHDLPAASCTSSSK